MLTCTTDQATGHKLCTFVHLYYLNIQMSALLALNFCTAKVLIL